MESNFVILSAFITGIIFSEVVFRHKNQKLKGTVSLSLLVNERIHTYLRSYIKRVGAEDFVILSDIISRYCLINIGSAVKTDFSSLENDWLQKISFEFGTLDTFLTELNQLLLVSIEERKLSSYVSKIPRNLSIILLVSVLFSGCGAVRTIYVKEPIKLEVYEKFNYLEKQKHLTGLEVINRSNHTLYREGDGSGRFILKEAK